ncbi:MAG: hypothetical protein A2Y15_07085 [Clostridiales bacterium GWF2_36_10]|nr:MAG: hypothetical protein A2Y15_07085 [Clostridiales bacterium GWF2_36_10]
MKKETERAKELLKQNNLSLVVIKDNEVYTSDKNGVKPVLELLENGNNTLNNSVAADKVIGGAAAFLFINGGVAEVYGEILSEKAVSVLEKAKIPCTYGTLVPFIKNRRGDDHCPLEKLCLTIESPEEAYEKIKEFLTVRQ